MQQPIKDILVLQRGIIYFLCRPKLEMQRRGGEVHEKEEAQRFIMLLNPKSSNDFLLIIVGKKRMPSNLGKSYFAFVDKIYHEVEVLMNDFQEKYYSTKTKGERFLPEMQLLGYGRYLIVRNQKRTDLIYRLSFYAEDKRLRSSFNLKEYDEFIIQVKNPASVGFVHTNKKLELPTKLNNEFAEHKFIPLAPIDLIFYEKIELLLNNSREKKLFKILPQEVTNYLYKEIKRELLPITALKAESDIGQNF